MSGKRKRVVVPLEMKLNALKNLDQGETVKKVARDLGVSVVTVGDWRKNRTEIEKWCSLRRDSKNKKTMKKGGYEKTSQALYRWFNKMKTQMPITGPILQAKALEFRDHFKEQTEAFAASSGWLDRWKRRFGVRIVNGSGEILSDSTEELATVIINNLQ